MLLFDDSSFRESNLSISRVRKHLASPTVIGSASVITTHNANFGKMSGKSAFDRTPGLRHGDDSQQSHLTENKAASTHCKTASTKHGASNIRERNAFHTLSIGPITLQMSKFW